MIIFKMLHQQLQTYLYILHFSKSKQRFLDHLAKVMVDLKNLIPTLMNILKPMTLKNYRKTVLKMTDAVNVVMLFIIGIKIKKIERVGHYQKRVGNWLRNLKKKEKGLARWDGSSYRRHNLSTAKLCRCN